MKARRTAEEERSRERALAWSAMLDVSTRTPFLPKADANDLDSSYIATVVVDSGPIINSLDALGHGLVDLNALFVAPLIEAAREVRVLAEMRPAWIQYCDEHSPAPTGLSRNTALRYINGPAMRTWSRAEEAKIATERAEQSLHRLHPALVEFYGFDVTGRRAA
ncbi:signal transduction histidine kinase-like protein [Streptomyces malaysiensis]|uniref:Signal transduction histidine kinase-like protein n=2 Tax=Streptomyces malaysiensis TaxID=92644 RepID=A0A7X5X2Q0_STRMQ|nr:signal transduction histidine kinase-like protein [Streptomyces malaysiensis]